MSAFAHNPVYHFAIRFMSLCQVSPPICSSSYGFANFVWIVGSWLSCLKASYLVEGSAQGLVY